MDGDGTDFSFSSAAEYLKGQDANDISWADIFLDGIHSDDAISAESGAGIHGAGQQIHHQAQQSMMGGQLQIHIPAQLHGSIASNAVQQAGTNLCGTVAYLTQPTSTHQYVNAAGGIHNVMAVAGHHPGEASSLGQQQNTKLLHIAPSFPVTQMSNGVPLQTLLQPNQSYGGQGFPAQGSVHIENPKVVNVNFGPHVIGSDGGGQQTIFQTAEGKRVLITNSQLQQMSQFQSGQGGQLIHSQPTLMSGPGLQVVGGGHGNQLQLIAQSSINQAGMGQQGTMMNLINNSGGSNQITGLMPGQNIFVNGQMLSFGQLRSLTLPQLHVQRNSQGGLTLADINAAVTCSAQFQPSTPQLVIQNSGQQQQILLQSKSQASPSVNTNCAPRLVSGLSGFSARTLTPNNSSASSTPVLTPTPSQTPELLADFPGSQGNLLKQALDMSNIDLDSFEDDISFLENSADCFSLLSNQPAPLKAVKKLAKSKSKSTKPKLKLFHQFENVPSNSSSSPFQQTTAHFGNTQSPGSQQKVITANGQVYVLSANNQQLILQPSAGATAAEYKPYTCSSVDRTQVSTPSGYHLDIKELNHNVINSNLDGQFKEFSQNNVYSNLNGQLRLKPHQIAVSSQDRNVFITAAADRNVFIKTCPDDTGSFQIETSSAFPTSPLVYATSSDLSRFPGPVSHTSMDFNQMHVQHMKSHKVLTSDPYAQQKPLMSVIKQEAFSDLEQSVSRAQTLAHMAASVGTPHTALSIPTSSFGAMTTPNLISSPSFTTVTTTTQSHHNTIMSIAQMSPVSSTGTYTSHSMAPSDVSVSGINKDYRAVVTSHSSGLSDGSVSAADVDYTAAVTSPTLFHSSLSSNSPVSVADSTLMLNVTPEQRQRLEQQLARMSKKDQKGFLAHQQHLLAQQSHQPHLQSEERQMEQDESSQRQHKQTQQQLYEPYQQEHHQPSRLETCYPAATFIHTAQGGGDPELLPPWALESGLPTTVQELVDRPEEEESNSLAALRQLQYLAAGNQVYPNLHVRPATASASPGQQLTIPPMGRCLAEQQLSRDRSLAVEPDVNSSFKSFSDAMRRLVRYHTLQDHKPEQGSKALRIWDSRYSKLCDYLVRKKRCYLRRFHKMRLYQDMCPEKQPDYIQNLMCFNEQLRSLIKSEKEGFVSRPDMLTQAGPAQVSSSWSASPVRASTAHVVSFRATSQGFSEKAVHNIFLKDLTINRHHCEQPGSELSRKRPGPSVGSSSGMLKLVFKRRTNDNLMFVRSSGTNLPRDFRPVVDLDKSDSEYEFDSNTADVTCNQPVIVRRRTLSAPSRQTSLDVGCDMDSVSSKNDEMCDSSTEEDTGGESDEEEELESLNDSSGTKDCIEMRRSSKLGYHVTFGDLAETKGSNYGSDESGSDISDGAGGDTCDSAGGDTSDDSGSDTSDGAGSDALMEEAEVDIANSSSHLSKVRATRSVGPSVSLCVDKNSSDFKSQRHPCHKVSAMPQSLFHLSLPYSQPPSLAGKDEAIRGSTCDGGQSLGRTGCTFDTQVDASPGTTSQTGLHDQEEVFRAESPVSNLEEEAARLPNCSLFTTPNKSLLKTDDMFNSEDEDQDVKCSSRTVSQFQIDKDPQSSMIDESVRSVINSVLNDGEDDDDDEDNKGSQASWVSSTSSSSSSGHRNLFQPYSSIMIPSGCSRDLDLPVHSIVNS